MEQQLKFNTSNAPKIEKQIDKNWCIGMFSNICRQIKFGLFYALLKKKKI